MGSYTFKWPHANAKDVLVTGTFDNWQKSIRLERKGDGFEKTVELPQTDANILYKYVVDGEWAVDPKATQEKDDKNIVNNVLSPADIVASTAGAGFISSVAPGASTAALAAAVPKETTSKNKKKKKKNKKNGNASGTGSGTASGQEDPTIQSAAPTSTTAALAGAVPLESRAGDKAVTSDPTISSVAPGSSTAALAGGLPKAPGGFPETPQDEPQGPEFSGKPVPAEEDKEPTFGVAPIPATAGVGNPIKLAPGEKVPDPSTITNNTVGSTARTDKASYEAGAAGAAVPSGQKEPEFSGKPVPATEDKEPTFGVAPIPATAGVGNPIKLAPGEKVPDPSTITNNTVGSTARTDKESYEAGAAGAAVPSGQKEPEFSGKPVPSTEDKEPTFGVAPIPATAGVGNPIKLAPGEKVPDPSTITDNTIGSTARTDKASYDAGAATVGANKSNEPTFSVAPIPATAGTGNPIKLAPGEKVPDSSTITNNTIGSTVRTDKASYDASDAGPASDIAKSLNTQGGAFGVPPVTGNMIPESSLPIVGGGAARAGDPTIQSAAAGSSTAALAGAVPKEPRGVPEAVTESQSLANAAPEAAGSAEAVREKSQVERELQSKFPVQSTETKPTEGLPPAVVQSMDKVHRPHEAADNPTAVQEKAAVERELTKEYKPVQATGEPAPKPDPSRLSHPATIPTNVEELKTTGEHAKSHTGAIAAGALGGAGALGAAGLAAGSASNRAEAAAEAAAPTPKPTPQKTPSSHARSSAASPETPSQHPTAKEPTPESAPSTALLSPVAQSGPVSPTVAAAAGNTMSPPGIPGAAPTKPQDSPLAGGAANAPTGAVPAVEPEAPVRHAGADGPTTGPGAGAEAPAGKKKRRSIFKRIIDKLK